QDEQLEIFQEESAVLKRKGQEEIAEYKEQIKQHAQTIVALEDSLLEAKQQQKMLEEENNEPSQGTVSFAGIFLVNFREELAAAQSTLLAKEAAIVRLTKELSESRARMSDMRGELSEKQKAELERSWNRAERQEHDLNTLREKLSEMSNLVAKKDRELKAAAAELRYKLLRAGGLPKLSPERLPGRQGRAKLSLGENRLGFQFQEPAVDLADLGAKCRGLRHEETIQRQKEGLAELRERIKALEKTRLSTVMSSKAAEPLAAKKTDLPEKRVQKAGLEKEAAPLAGGKMKCSKCLGRFPNGCSHVTTSEAASLEVSEVLDLGERMYLDLIGALGSLMNMKELAGMQPVQHLPQEERGKVGQQRRKDFELLYEKISKLKSRLERKEEMLKDYEARIEQLRLNQVSLQTCQEEMLKLEDEVYREAEEKALLREALERTRVQLGQEKRLNRAVKQRKV
ncbi:FHAD1 protein, partial [Chauna torquata]|nr:FHAD1 protein [Chauna torquata]